MANTKKTLDDLKKQLEQDEDSIEETPNVSFIPQLIEPEELTDKQLKFIDEYITTLNGAQSAIAAGYSEASSRVQSHRLLTNDNIRSEIRQRQQAEIIKNGIKRADTYKMLLETINDINIRIAMDIEGEFIGLIKEKINVIDKLNKMGGFYAAETQINIQNNIDISKLFGFENNND